MCVEHKHTSDTLLMSFARTVCLLEIKSAELLFFW